MRFEDLALIEPLVRAVRSEGYAEPTPIQEQAIPQVLAGRDLLGCAQTGTGKTAAFALPILQRLFEQHPPRSEPHGAAPRPIRVLVLSPTRELASQIGDSFATYGRHLGFRHTVIFGGVGQDAQTRALRRGVDILIATPGRLLDLMGQGFVRFDRLEVLVLDEADRMLDMGFIHDVERVIAALPRRRQTLFFSATLPRDIQELARHILSHPVRVEVTPQATTVEAIAQSVYFVETSQKRALLEHLLADPTIARVLVFTRTKHGANRLARLLERAGLRASAIHGNKSQSARERALDEFKGGDVRVLVATDIAARGLDVEGITHVINYDLPNVPESYVHRIGRTARAGASGVAIALCDGSEREYLRDIQQLIRMEIPVVREHPFAGASGPARREGPERHAASKRAAAPGGHERHSRGRPPGRGHSRRAEPRSDRHAGPPAHGRPVEPAAPRQGASPALPSAASGSQRARSAADIIADGLRNASRRRGRGRGPRHRPR
jgi:ATP-dependent RNA helicase RhlE